MKSDIDSTAPTHPASQRGTGAAGGYYSAILSFLLPGSGQLFGHRYKAAVVFFALFAACLSMPSTVGVSFLVALVAGVECLSRERSLANFKFSKRFFFYLTVSFLGFLIWFFAVGSQFIFGRHADAADAAPAAVNTDLVDLKKIDFTIHVDMVFASEANISGKKLLPENRCLLRKPVAVALARVQESLKLRQLSLKILDCYHPSSLEIKFNDWLPQTARKGAFTLSNPIYRGAAVDAVLVQSDGVPLTLPDSYEWSTQDWTGQVRTRGRSERGRAFTGATQRNAAKNVKILTQSMKREGFIADSKRWWNFRYNNWEQYVVSDIPFSEIP